MKKLDYYNNLKIKLKKKSAVICIIGLGYVGLELLKNFEKKKFNIIGIDLNKKKLKKLKKIRRIYLYTICIYILIRRADSRHSKVA